MDEDEATRVSKESGQTIRSLLISAGLPSARTTQHSGSWLKSEHSLSSHAGVLACIASEETAGCWKA